MVGTTYKATELRFSLADNIVTVTPGWSEAYGLFLDGEADAVLSYTTSPAYHLIAEQDRVPGADLGADLAASAQHRIDLGFGTLRLGVQLIALENSWTADPEAHGAAVALVGDHL